MPRLTTERLVDHYWELRAQEKLREQATEIKALMTEKERVEAQLGGELADLQERAQLFDRWKDFLAKKEPDVVWEALEDLLVSDTDEMRVFSRLWSDTFPLNDEAPSGTSLKTLMEAPAPSETEKPKLVETDETTEK